MVWIIFIACILIFLALDLGLFNRKAHVIKTKEAAIWTGIWVLVASLFSGVIWWVFDKGLIENPTDLTPGNATLKYITGYLIELSLSIDNVFVIAVIFRAFNIPDIYQHRVLFWGILGAIFFRAVMIIFGVALINQFEWVIYIFGVFLIYTAFKMYRSDEKEFNPKESFVFRKMRKIIPFTAFMDGDKFLIKRRNIVIATPLLMSLIIIELTDILFALDSIPAILAITSNPFIVFSSNILAILGLRSMYFMISRMLNKFRFINFSLIVILSFVGLKMIFTHFIEIPEWISLSVIFFSLIGGILASVYIKENPETL